MTENDSAMSSEVLGSNTYVDTDFSWLGHGSDMASFSASENLYNEPFDSTELFDFMAHPDLPLAGFLGAAQNYNM